MHSLDDLFIKPSELHGNEKINVMNDKFSDIYFRSMNFIYVFHLISLQSYSIWQVNF